MSKKQESSSLLEQFIQGNFKQEVQESGRWCKVLWSLPEVKQFRNEYANPDELHLFQRLAPKGMPFMLVLQKDVLWWVNNEEINLSLCDHYENNVAHLHLDIEGPVLKSDPDYSAKWQKLEEELTVRTVTKFCRYAIPFILGVDRVTTSIFDPLSDGGPNLIVLDGSGKDRVDKHGVKISKKSFHVVFRQLPITNFSELKRIFTSLKETYENMTGQLENCEHVARYIDTSIYTRHHSFRMQNQSKYGIDPGFFYTDYLAKVIVYPEELESGLNVFDGLKISTLHPSYKPVAEVSLAKKIKDSEKTHGETGRSSVFNNIMPEDDANKLIAKIRELHDSVIDEILVYYHIGSQIRINQDGSELIYLYNVRGNKYKCQPPCSRIHESNNMAIIHNKSGFLVVICLLNPTNTYVVQLEKDIPLAQLPLNKQGIDHKEVKGHNLSQLTGDQTIDLDDPNKPVIWIKSQTGTGKSELLQQWQNKNPQKTGAFLCVRKSMKDGLTSIPTEGYKIYDYENFQGQIIMDKCTLEHFNETFVLYVQINSFYKINAINEYDYIVFDESVSISYLLMENLASFSQCLGIKPVVCSSPMSKTPTFKKIIIMDALLDQVNINFFTELFVHKFTPQQQIIYENIYHKPYTYHNVLVRYLNDEIDPETGEVKKQHKSSKKQILYQLLKQHNFTEKIRNTNECFTMSFDERKELQFARQMLSVCFGISDSLILVMDGNTPVERKKAIISNVNGVLSDGQYRIFMYTTTITVGVSIILKNFKTHYSVYQGRTSTYFEQKQQGDRSRNCSNNYVISGRVKYSSVKPYVLPHSCQGFTRNQYNKQMGILEPNRTISHLEKVDRKGATVRNEWVEKMDTATSMKLFKDVKVVLDYEQIFIELQKHGPRKFEELLWWFNFFTKANITHDKIKEGMDKENKLFSDLDLIGKIINSPETAKPEEQKETTKPEEQKEKIKPKASIGDMTLSEALYKVQRKIHTDQPFLEIVFAKHEERERERVKINYYQPIDCVESLEGMKTLYSQKVAIMANIKQRFDTIFKHVVKLPTKNTHGQITGHFYAIPVVSVLPNKKIEQKKAVIRSTLDGGGVMLIESKNQNGTFSQNKTDYFGLASCPNCYDFLDYYYAQKQGRQE